MYLFSKKTSKKRKAFSLVELMITCIIIGVLVSIAVPQYMSYRLRAETHKAIATLYVFAQAQKEYWFDQDPNTYADQIVLLTPDYTDTPVTDGDWNYQVDDGDATTYTLRAIHLDGSGAPDTLELTLDQDGVLTYEGPDWPFTIVQAP